MTGDPTPSPAEDATAEAARVALRRSARVARRAITDERRARLVAGLCDRLLELIGEPDDRRTVVALSVAADGEPDVTGLAGELRRRGWTLALPVVADSTSMTFREWPDGAPLVANRFGIPEPTGTEELAPDVVVVPCVVVDAAGNRLGFGKGFYDRALAGDRPWTVGAVFDEQVVEVVPTGTWDVPLDAVVTPTRTLRPGR